MPAGQQVKVDEHEQILERVAAIDVAKASGMVCVRMPHATKPEEMRFLTPTEIVTLAEPIRPTYRALVFVAAYGLVPARPRRRALTTGLVSGRDSSRCRCYRLTGGPERTGSLRCA